MENLTMKNKLCIGITVLSIAVNIGYLFFDGLKNVTTVMFFITIVANLVDTFASGNNRSSKITSKLMLYFFVLLGWLASYIMIIKLK